MATKKLKINFKMPTPTAAERLHAQQQKNRKAAGLPDPSEYKKKLDAMKSEEVEQLDELKKSTVSSYMLKRGAEFRNNTDPNRTSGSPEVKKHIKNMSRAVSRMAGTKPVQKEEVEQIDEISSQLKASYVAGAKKQIKQSMPFTKKTDEYRDIAKNFIAKRQKGIAKANEEVELLDENEDKVNARKMYHKHFVASMKSMASSPKQKHHQAEMAKYKAMMGDSFVDQVAPKKFAKFDKKTNEEVEPLDEYESKGGVYKHTAKLASSHSYGGEPRKLHDPGNMLHKGRTADFEKHTGMQWKTDELRKAQTKKTLMNVHKNLPEEVEQLDEMPESNMKTKDVHSHLKKSGWSLARSKGGHDVYKHPKAKHSIPVPRHNQLKAPLIRGIMKASKVEEQLEKKGRFVSGPVKQPYKSNTIVTAIKESVTVGRMVGRGNIYQYDRNPGPRDGSELEHVPFHAKTEKQKKLQKALTDLGNKMKQTHPKLKEDSSDDIIVYKKGTNVRQKIKANSYDTFKSHGFRKEEKDSQEYDYEGDMAKSDLRSIIYNAKELHDMLDDNTNLAEWCQSKITLAEDYISTVTNYMRSEMNEETMQEDKHDYQRKIEKNNKKFIAASKRQKNPLTNVHTAQTKQKPVKEDIELDEGRASQRHPLEGHEYHKKSNEALVHIAKDAHAAAEAMKSHNPQAENKYRDQANDSATVRHFRKTSGMPDWYKKKYGHVNEDVGEPTEGEMKGKQGYSRKAQIVMNAAGKSKKLDSSEKFQKDPELSSEIHKT